MGVVQFYDGKAIFITGATGFMGKVLIEKLLRSCPGIEKIYVLLRPKKGCSIEERLEKFKELNIFERIKKNNPDVLDKVIGIPGDVSELNLGLSDSDRKLLVDNVNIIYHSAASVRFDDFLEDAIILNVRGTREIAQLALDLKNPSIFVHISTAFSNTHHTELEERLYPPHTNWKDAILLAETCDKELLHTMTEKYIYPYVNTYTFAKGLGEHVVNDMCKGKIQTIITRPSIVMGTLEEPIAGWIDNLNGPAGLMVAAGKGLLRVFLLQINCRLNYIPVDIAIKGIILATYNSTTKSNKYEVEVYNITQRIINTSQGKFFEIAAEMGRMTPLSNVVLYPNSHYTTCIYNYYIQFLLLHILPAIFFDLLLRLSGKKPMVFRLQRKIYIASYILRHFVIQNYIFNNDKMIDMQKNLKDDEQDFRYTHVLTEEGIFDYLRKLRFGVSLNVLKEPLDPTGRKEFKNMERPCVRICQINIEGISRAKCDVPQKILEDNDIDIIAMQEAHTENEEPLIRRGRTPGYDLGLRLVYILLKTILFGFLSWLLLVKWNSLKTSGNYLDYYFERI